MAQAPESRVNGFLNEQKSILRKTITSVKCSNKFTLNDTMGAIVWYWTVLSYTMDMDMDMDYKH